MPIYEFVCNHCHKKFDLLCKLNADLSQIKCEFCNSSNVTKVVSNFITNSSSKTFDFSSTSSSSNSSCSACSTHSCSTCGH